MPPTSQELRPIVWVWPRDVVILVVEDDVESLEMTMVRLVVVPIDGEVRPLEVLFTGIDDALVAACGSLAS